jgi:hypothetical protein
MQWQWLMATVPMASSSEANLQMMSLLEMNANTISKVIALYNLLLNVHNPSLDRASAHGLIRHGPAILVRFHDYELQSASASWIDLSVSF